MFVEIPTRGEVIGSYNEIVVKKGSVDPEVMIIPARRPPLVVVILMLKY